MDLRSEILREHSRHQADRIASWVGRDRARFRELITLFLRGDFRTAQRTAWVVNICAERNPDLVQPYLNQIVRRAQQTGVHDAVRRNVTRILQSVDIPDTLLGTVATFCFDLLNGDSPVAVKALSMSVLDRIVRREPELGRELRLVVSQQLPYASAAFRARARKILGKKFTGDEQSTAS